MGGAGSRRRGHVGGAIGEGVDLFRGHLLCVLLVIKLANAEFARAELNGIASLKHGSLDR